VRVALDVGVRVVLAMVGHPRDDRALHGHRAQRRERVLDGLGRQEGAVREHAVVADGDPQGSQQVHGGEDREVGGVHDTVPQQHDGGQRRGEGERDGRQVHGLLGSGHARHGMRPAAHALRCPAKSWPQKL
jgi:hypothetical protein